MLFKQIPDEERLNYVLADPASLALILLHRDALKIFIQLCSAIPLSSILEGSISF